MAMGITSGGNVCALLVRTITFLLLLYAIVLSTMTISSCHFLSAISPDNTPHGVGLTSFEMENGNCLSHTSFITSNYNGMELTAKIGGYLAPLFGVLTILFIVFECCKGDEWFCAGKCLPCLLLLLSVVCQGLTFMLFKSTLFCSQTTEIDRCIMDEAAYRSVQATICYFLCFILYLCGRTPKPLCLGLGSRTKSGRGGARGGGGGGSSTKKSGKKKKGEFTKEDYEQRRKEKKIKSRGVSGRSKQQILQDINGGGGDEKKKKSRRLSSSGSSRKKSSSSSRKEDSYSPSRRGGGANDSQPTYDDYVDTEPDGMDWSAYDPKEREEYYDRKRSRESQRREQERGRDGDEDYYDEEEQLYRRRNEDDYSEYTDDRDRDRGRGGRDDDYGSRYSEQSGSRYSGSAYVGTVYDESGRSLYSRGERGGYGDEESYRSGRPPRDNRYADDDYKDDEYTRGEDSFMSDGQSYDDRGRGRGDDGYHDDRHNDSYYSEEDHRSRRSNLRRDDGYDEASYDASYGDDGYGRRRGDDDYYDDRPLD